ncbi:unnamed protein product [Rotaria magnacalcarata]|uniref:PDZ domain-containing protein n=6 Tax=Rotaria magnacalcarata TaxID=392030 RepID=A0A816AZZ6_9BILA|nr:unnamed protein product [Rotaria magnacalcarata]CAF1602215.1 unnamed protein product [Rotaria magnacalcarata]CAF1931599.1 unnamed protein product [Rotaria magnacalcarata]CAF4592503.1 unnamed protein product [Rotaria magnacalcarata]
MLTVSSSSFTPIIRGPIFRRRRRSSSSSSSDLYRPRTIILEKSTPNASYGFSIQTYGFASLNSLSCDESLISSSSESTTSRKSSASTLFCSPSQTPPIQLVTYIDYVQDKSPAWEAGLRPGSVILSVNDKTVENDDHETLVQRITQPSSTQLKLIIVQQNINKQISLCEKLQQLHKQLHDKEEELETLCKQEIAKEQDTSVKEIESPLPRLQLLTVNQSQRDSSFCHDKIPLDWRQSVTNFAHQRKSINRTLPSLTYSSASKYLKYHQSNPSQRYQRSMSLTTVGFNHSKSSLRHHHSLLLKPPATNHRRALSYEELFSSNPNKHNIYLDSQRPDESMIESGCSLAMDLSRSSDRKQSESESSSSSTATINTDDVENNQKEKNENKVKQFKWKLRINK